VALRSAAIACFAIFACSAVGAAHAADEAKKCTLQRVASLDTDTSQGRLLIKVQIEGRDSWLAVDTGSPVGLISRAVVDELKIPLRQAREGAIIDAAGQSAQHFVVVRKLNLNGMVAEDSTFIVMGENGTGAMREDGIFAANFLAAYDVELDLAHHKMNLFTQDHCPGNVVYWTQDYVAVPFHLDASLHATFDASLNDQPLRALLDTGASSTILSAQVARHRFDFDPVAAGTVPDGNLIAGGGELLPFYLHRFQSLTLGGVQFRNTEVKVMTDHMTRVIRDRAPKESSAMEETKETPLIVGLSHLARLRVYIAYGEQMVYFSAASAK
jgi:hypothetical protein